MEDIDVTEFMELFADKFKRCLKTVAEPFLRETGLKVHHIIFISRIGRSEGISQKDLKSQLPYDKSRVSMVITELIALGIVEDQSVGKTAHLELTEKGQALYREVLEIAADFKRKLTDGLDDEEKAAFMACLRKLDRNMDAMLGNEHQ